VIEMEDRDAGGYFVQDILGGAGSWRWTAKHPEIRIRMQTNQKLRYIIDFTIVEATFKDTGPLEFSFYVNGHLLDHLRYTASGDQHFEKPVPEDWVVPGQEAMVGAEVDKVWSSPADHQTLGFILTRLGLSQE
jgi:hypothetical protein